MEMFFEFEANRRVRDKRKKIKTCLNISDRLGFGFQMQHPDPSGWNRFKNKTLGVSWLNVFLCDVLLDHCR